jgi:NTP pyrophosphatase (non-canonical NTP hydrolase)
MEFSRLQEELEAVSRAYAKRYGIERTGDWLILKLNEEMGELTQAYLARTGQGRDKGQSAQTLRADFEDELADVLAHVVLIAGRFDVDLLAAIEQKWLAFAPPRS